MESKSLAGDALKEFFTDYGVPDKIIMDGTGEQTGKRSTFMEQVRKHHIDYHVTEPEQYNQSWVEEVIREIQKKMVQGDDQEIRAKTTMGLQVEVGC